MCWATIFVTAACFMTVHSQTWNGTFIPDSACNTGTCCCVSSEIIITRPTSSLLAFNGSLNGVCLGRTSFSSTAAYPNGYTVSITISIVTLGITLSNDSNTLTIANSLSSSCTVIAVRQVTTVTTVTPVTTVTTVTTITPVTAVTTVTTVTTSTVRSNAVRQYINIIMLFYLVFSSSLMNI